MSVWIYVYSADSRRASADRRRISIFCVRLLRVCSFNYTGHSRASSSGTSNEYGSHAFLFYTSNRSQRVAPSQLWEMKRLVILLFCIISVASIRGENAAVFNKCSWKTEGNDMVLILDLDVNGYKDKQLSVCAYIYNADGTRLKDTNGYYRAKDGQVAASTKIKPKYDNTNFSNLSITIPVSELHPRPGENGYYINFEVFHGNESIGYKSKALTYKLTGDASVNYSSGGSYASNGSGSANSSNDICTGCSGSGKMTCSVCSGTGTNPIPRPIVNYYTYQTTYVYDKCMMCGGSGIRACWICNGTGKMPKNYGAGAGGYYYNPGFDNDFGSGSSSHGNSNRSSSSKANCPYCNGTGVTMSQSSGGNLSSHVAYYNSAGNTCPYCGCSNKHYHTKCLH